MRGKKAKSKGDVLRVRQFEERDRAELERLCLKVHPGDQIIPELRPPDSDVRLVLEDSDQEALVVRLEQQMRIARRLRKPVAREPRVLPPAKLSGPEMFEPGHH